MRVQQWLAHPVMIAGLVAGAYLGQAQQVLDHPHRFDYVKMDLAHARNGYGHSSTIDWGIRQGPVHRDGYDGQFFFYIALDPVGAAPYLDAPAYRYGRIGYPLVARAVAMGRRERVRGALVVVNALAMAAATLFLGLIYVRLGLSAWWSILVATYPGLMLVAFARDTAEPLAYALAIGGVWILIRAKLFADRTAIAAGALFAAAALTRETTLLFALPAALALATARRPAVILAAVSLLPYVAWKSFLAIHFGDLGSGGIVTSLIPLDGILSVRPWNQDQWLVVLTVMIPVVVWVALAVRVALARRALPASLIVLANCVLMLFVDPSVFDGYASAGRVATGATVASLVAYPSFRGTWGRRAMFAAVMAWSLPWWLLMGPPARWLAS